MQALLVESAREDESLLQRRRGEDGAGTGGRGQPAATAGADDGDGGGGDTPGSGLSAIVATPWRLLRQYLLVDVDEEAKNDDSSSDGRLGGGSSAKNV